MSVKTIGRAQGRSATAACAYRSAARIEDERTGNVFDYQRKSGVEHTEIFAPANAPAWAYDRQAVWNAAEQAETRKNSTVAREFEVALPAELTPAQRVALVQDFARDLVARHGMVVDVSIHAPHRDGDERNHHAHVLCSTRRMGLEGFTEKTRELDDKKLGEVEHWRARWAEIANSHLERAGVAERIDHRSLKEQGIEREATKHLGPNVIQMERRGIETEKGAQVRTAEQRSALVIDLAEVRKQIAAEEVAEAKRDERPSLLSAARDAGRERPSLLGQSDQPRAALADRIPPPRSREIVLAEWQTEKARQFRSVQDKAGRVDRYGRQLLAKHEQRREQHQLGKPVEPSGLLASVRRGAYEVAFKAWDQTRAVIQNRIDRLSRQIELLAGYMRKAAPYEIRLSAGEELAEKRARQSNPALASEVDRQQQEKDTMAKEATLYSRGEKAVEKEREQLQRDGQLAAKLAQATEKEEADRQGKGPDDHAKRVADNLERIKAQRAKEREDRDNGKGRGFSR